MTNSSGEYHCIEGGEEKSRVGKTSPDSSISVDLRAMKQLDASAKGGSGCDDKEVAPLVVNGGDDKRNCDNKQKENENEESGKRDMQMQSSDHDKNLRTEKQRRKKMKNLIHELNALLPKQLPKTNLISTVDGAISYIRKLQQTIQKLEARKQARVYVAANGSSSGSSTSGSGRVLSPPVLFKTWTSSNVSLNLCGVDAHINICSSKKSGLLTVVCFVLEKYKFDIISAQISSDQFKSMLMIHARLQAGFLIEEICKQAALEINNALA